jgi:sugar lactone lactonase YvrE
MQTKPQHMRACSRGLCGVALVFASLFLGAAQARATTYVLGTSTLTVGANAGTSSVVLGVTPATNTWIAVPNSEWLHLSPPNENGTGSANVIFSYDANPGLARFGTLTISGQTLTVAQLGSNYVEAGAVTTLANSGDGLTYPAGVAVDSVGNVYIANYAVNQVDKWTVANNTFTTLISSGLNGPEGLAVDAAGNVYIADSNDAAVKKWTAASNSLSNLASGLSSPQAVALDASGNVYIADNGDSTVKEWYITNGSVVTLVSSDLNNPDGVAVDAAGNVYIGDNNNNAIQKWTADSGTLSTLVSGLTGIDGIAIDGSGNIYIANYGASTVQEWIASDNTVTTLVSSGLYQPETVTVDASGDLYICDTWNSAIKEWPRVFVDPAWKYENLSAGTDSISIFPTTQNLPGPFAPTSSTWLQITSVSNGLVNFSFPATPTNRLGAINILGQNVFIVQAGVSFQPAYSLGTTRRLEGPASGNDSAFLAVTPGFASWTNSANASWLHLNAANQNGSGSGPIVFSFDANSGTTRSGTLTIAGQTVTVTQAASTYTQVEGVALLASNGLSSPSGVAVDGAGNVYIADYGNNAIKKWTAANDTVTALVSSGLSSPYGLAVDGAGNVYFADNGNNAIKEWTAANGHVVTLVSNGLNSPQCVALDSADNVYFTDTGNSLVKELVVSNGSVITLVSSGLNQPNGVGVDAAGNVYIGDYNKSTLEEWIVAAQTLAPLVPNLSGVDGLAVDGGGNVFIANYGHGSVQEWKADSGAIITLDPSLDLPIGVAVDGTGNIYMADTGYNAVRELPYAFVDTSSLSENADAGSDALPAVLPATANLTGIFAPVSDQSWLVITGITNDVVSYSFTMNFGPPRTAHINLLGESVAITQQNGPSYLSTVALSVGPNGGTENVALTTTGSWTATANASWLHVSSASQSGTGSAAITFTFDTNTGPARLGTLTIDGLILEVTQAAPVCSLGTYALLERPGAGIDGVVFSINYQTPAWTATVNAPWLHLSLANQSGVGSANIVFSYDANPGPIRSGTISIASQTLTVTQAGSTYVAAQGLATLPSMGPGPDSVAVDSLGDLYAGESYFGDIYPGDYPFGAASERYASNGVIASLFSAEDYGVLGLAVDADGNVYFSSGGYYDNNGVYEWTRTNGEISTLVSGYANGIALDFAGDVYIADEGNSVIEEWYAANKNLFTLVSNGMNSPSGVAVDVVGNVYIANTGSNTIVEWPPGYTNVLPLVTLGLNAPQGIAVDGSGNVYIADTGNNAVKEWMRASNVVTTLVSNLNRPVGVTVDASGDVYIDEFASSLGPDSLGPGNGDVKELGRVFVDPTLRLEGLTACSDSLPPVLPATENLLGLFAPVSHEPWLIITGVTNGVVSFAFSATTSSRTGYISVLGQTIPVAQGAESFSYSLGTTSLLEGPTGGTDSVVLGASTYFAHGPPRPVSLGCIWIKAEWVARMSFSVTTPIRVKRGPAP